MRDAIWVFFRQTAFAAWLPASPIFYKQQRGPVHGYFRTVPANGEPMV